MSKLDTQEEGIMFCRKCGNQIPDDSLFCQFCGTATAQDAAPNSGNTDKKYTLTFDRQSQIYVLNPPVKITIDESIRLTVENGHCESVELAPGQHKISLQSSVRSTMLDIDLQRNSVVEISWNRLTGKLVTKVR